MGGKCGKLFSNSFYIFLHIFSTFLDEHAKSALKSPIIAYPQDLKTICTYINLHTKIVLS